MLQKTRALLASRRCVAVGWCSQPPFAVGSMRSAATAPPARPQGQLHQPTGSTTAAGLLVRCGSTNTGISASDGSRGRRGRREPTAGTESSSPTPHGSKKPAADAELLPPFLQEALRPLPDTCTAESLKNVQREQLAALEQQTQLVKALVDGLEKQQEVLRQQQDPELMMRLVRLLEAALSDQQQRRCTAAQQRQADLVDAAPDKQHEHVVSSQQQQLASIRDLLEQQQRRQETNWQQLLASSQRQEQLLLKLLERLDTAAPPAATAVPAGQQGEAPAAAEGGGGGLPVVAADDGLRLGEREQPAVASSTDGDAEACGQPAVGSGAGTAGTEGQQQQQRQVDESVPPRLLDYVRFREEVRIPRSSGEDSREDVIPAGAEGVVLASADGGTRLKVYTLEPPSDGYWCSTCCWIDRPDVLERVADERDLTSTARRRQPLPYDPQRQGVPVTRFTAAPGMLVRRGYDVASGEDAAATESGEVGVVQPSRGLGDTCVVEWASGRQAEYDTGRGNRFQLVHLEMSLESGAPVVGSIAAEERQGDGGSVQDWELHGWELAALQAARGSEGTHVSLERGTHWIGLPEEPWDGGVELPKNAFPDGTVWIWCSNTYGFAESAWMPASPTAGYSLCCSVYKWQPVNLFTARQGVNLAMGLPHRERWGTLVRPVEVRADGVVWLLDLREPERPEARQVPFLFGPCTGKLLLLEGMDPNPELWAEPVWGYELYGDCAW